MQRFMTVTAAIFHVLNLFVTGTVINTNADPAVLTESKSNSNLMHMVACSLYYEFSEEVDKKLKYK